MIDFVGKVDGVAVRRRHRRGHVGRARLGQPDPRLRGPAWSAPRPATSATLNVTFPDDYPAANLKGKAATFDIKVKAVKTAGETKIDDDFAKQLGLNDLDQLKGLIRDQQQQELNGLTRTHMKRRLLDQLAAEP